MTAKYCKIVLYRKGGRARNAEFMFMKNFSLKSNIGVLSGVGPVRVKQFARLGIETVEDLIYHFPRAYEYRADVKEIAAAPLDVQSSFMLTVATEVRTANVRRGLSISKFRAFDDTGSVEVVFFNSPFVKDIFHIGSSFRFWGKLEKKKSSYTLANPKYEPYIPGTELPDFVPIYRLTEGINSKFIEKAVFTAISELISQLNDPLPENIRLKHGLSTLSYAIRNIHFPENPEALTRALRRLAFDEMLLFGLGISSSAKYKRVADALPFSPCSLEPFTALLPYLLTGAQKRAINDIYRDTVRKDDECCPPMARILVGDVGSGKTVCALAAAYIAAKSGMQTALMVPTEILAVQHYEDAKVLFDKLGIIVELLTGSTTAKEKKRILAAMESGEAQLIIGTHALISEKTVFNRLGLVITDEQHRFGVTQRALLKEKGASAHLLVMSATPIPRSLALSMYGDLDASIIDEMPKGRKRVDTYVVDESYRERLNSFIEAQIKLGGQCYIVCPSIEKNEDTAEEYILTGLGMPERSGALQLKNAVEYADALKSSLPHRKIECLHGRMKPQEKDAVMSRFVSGDTDVLVSTTVIEVGVNVPNASLMIIENAERFGLSQLHQLRGRVGRGERKSFCVLVSDSKTDKARERLEIMKTTYDGYKIAERDLIMRGPGDFFSSKADDTLRQSGGFSFKVANLCDDPDLLSSAFEAAKSIIEDDPELKRDEHLLLRDKLSELMVPNLSNIS